MKQLLTGFALLLLLTAPALATESSVSEAATDADLALLTEPAATASLNTREKSFLDAIADLENHYGPYHSHLPQHLMGLGVNYQNRGQHAEAEEIFRRAMHVSRISEGLYSLTQIPMLERLIETTVAQGDWADANDSHRYLYWLYQRNYGENDPRMLPAILKLAHWHLHAHSADDGNRRFEHLVNAHNLYLLAVDLISTSFGSNDLRVVEALKGLTVTNYYLATHQPSAGTQIEFQTGFGNTRAAAADEQARQDQYILKSYSSGRNAIARMYEVLTTNPDAPPGAEISAQIQLADWNLMFNRWQSALDQYLAAYRSMAATSEGRAKADEFFSRPVALPDLPLMKSAGGASSDDAEYVVVSFDVATNGSTHNIRILESHPEDDTRNRAQVRRALKQAKFRPRFADGAPTITEQVTHRYVFTN